MAVEQFSDRVILRHPKGPSLTVLLYGATIISWMSGSIKDSSNLKERLFVSSKAILDGTKSVRGGIPVVFPCFGAPNHPEHTKLGQHGFARNEVWKWDSVVMDNAAGVSIRLVLEPTPRIKALYAKSFRLNYIVTLAEHQLSTDLHVENKSLVPGEVFEFQALLHTYLLAPSNEVAIGPLQNVTFYDKTEPTPEGQATPKKEQRVEIDVRKYTDAVYENAPQKYHVLWTDAAVEIKAVNFKDLVVWNPRDEGRKISDMEDGGWDKYVCVEPGFVKGFVKLEPGQIWTGQQVITIQK